MDDLSTYPTDIRKYDKMRLIGRGTFGQVFTIDKLGLGSQN